MVVVGAATEDGKLTCHSGHVEVKGQLSGTVLSCNSPLGLNLYPSRRQDISLALWRKFVCFCYLFIYFGTVSSCLRWPQTHYVAKASLGLPTLLPLPSTWWVIEGMCCQAWSIDIFFVVVDSSVGLVNKCLLRIYHAGTRAGTRQEGPAAEQETNSP